MYADETDPGPLLRIVREIFENMPFNQLLGLKVDHLETNRAGFTFPITKDLIGNTTHRILHGGVISGVLDATGGMMAIASTLVRMQGFSPDEIKHRIFRNGTLDMRIDYLRPGKGVHFFSNATVIRTGNKIAVIRMELKNQEDMLIAVGTGAYTVG
jgi:uncharacterized protein (TIGR00369 family)